MDEHRALMCFPLDVGLGLIPHLPVEDSQRCDAPLRLPHLLLHHLQRQPVLACLLAADVGMVDASDLLRPLPLLTPTGDKAVEVGCVAGDGSVPPLDLVPELLRLLCQDRGVLFLLLNGTLHRPLVDELPLELALQLPEVFVEMVDHTVLGLQRLRDLVKFLVQDVLEFLQGVHLHLVALYLELLVGEGGVTLPPLDLEAVQRTAEFVRLLLQALDLVGGLLLLLLDALAVLLHLLQSLEQGLLLGPELHL
mmetsp:Transcript_26435/g.74637  ORF Transcript_26435/g.74637 Transcript_26435/m.74637 type:complete len:251 (+) Transcript_26435:748-1500(+)